MGGGLRVVPPIVPMRDNTPAGRQASEVSVVPRPVRLTFRLTPENVQGLRALVRRKGGHQAGVTFTGELNRAVAQYLAEDTAGRQITDLAPVLSELLDHKLGHMETWLRPMLASGGIHATTAMLLALELMCGTRIQPDQARELLDLMRGRAYKLFRRRGDGEVV